jgi:hypothetical protein
VLKCRGGNPPSRALELPATAQPIALGGDAAR